MVLYTAENGDFETFNEIMNHLEENYKPKVVNNIERKINNADDIEIEGEVANDR